MIPHYAQNLNKPAQALGSTTDIAPKETLYINNLNDKIKPSGRKSSSFWFQKNNINLYNVIFFFLL